MKILRKIKISDNVELRDFTEPWPPEGFCPLCGKSDDECKCEKFNCKCNILAINCYWPECLCKECLEINCECNNNE